jgi:hypothetical protein
MQYVEMENSELFQFTYIHDIRAYLTSCLIVVVRHFAILKKEERSVEFSPSLLN